MTDAQKRQYVSNLYSGPKWKKQVEKMDMGQVLAIYLDHQNDGSKPHHDEEGDQVVDIPVMPEFKRLTNPVWEPTEEELKELKPEPSAMWVNQHLNNLPPQPPHENEDDFPTY